MRHINCAIVSLIFQLSVFVSLPTGAYAQSACGSVNGEITTLGDSAEVAGLGWCLITPERMQIKLHFIGLCTTAPTWQNFDTVCEEVFSSNSGTLATIEKGAPLPLVGEISIPEGNYTHAAIFIGNQIKHASLIKFNSNRIGQQGTGTWCWSTSNGNASVGIPDGVRAGYIADCGDNPPASSEVGYNVSTATSVADDTPPDFRGDYTTGTTASTTWEVFVLDENRGRDTNPATPDVENAAYFIGIQRFNTPVIITANTSSVDLGFRLTNTFGLNVDENTVDGSGNKSHVKGFVLGGFEFKVVPK